MMAHDRVSSMGSGEFDPSPRLPTTSGERVGLWLAGLILAGLFAAEVLSNFTPARLSIPFMLLWWGPLLVLHEVGHALAARMVGWRVDEMVIGFGRDIAEWRWGNTRVRVKVLPVEGYVVPAPSQLKGARYHSAVIYAAGPGIELLFILLLRLVLGPQLWDRTEDATLLFWQSGAVAAALGALFNLIPYPVSGGVSDGLGVLISLFAPRQGFESRLAWPFVRRVRESLLFERYDRAAACLAEGLDNYPKDVQLLGLSAVLLAANGEQDAAFERLESLGHPDDRPPVERAVLLQSAAWVVLLGTDQTLLHQAQHACERALSSRHQESLSYWLLGRVALKRNQAQRAAEAFASGYNVASSPVLEGTLVGWLLLASLSTGQLETAGRFARIVHRSPMSEALRAEVERRIEHVALP